MSTRKTKWKMPEWMELYRSYIHTSGHSVEDLMNGRSEIQINAPLALIEMACEGQIGLLFRLHEAGLLTQHEGARTPLRELERLAAIVKREYPSYGAGETLSLPATVDVVSAVLNTLVEENKILREGPGEAERLLLYWRLPFIALSLSALPSRRLLSDHADIEQQHMQTWVRLDAVLDLLEKHTHTDAEEHKYYREKRAGAQVPPDTEKKS